MSARRRILGEKSIFAVEYDPSRVHFERIPASIIGSCPNLQDRYVEGWVYGHLKTDSTEYFVVSGLMQFEEDKPGGARTIAAEEGDGIAVALRVSTRLVDQADYFFDQKVNPAKHATRITAPKSDLIGIMQDAFKRCAIAFEGKQECLKRAHPDAIGPETIRQQLEIFTNLR